MFKGLFMYTRRANMNRSLSSMEEHAEKILKDCDIFSDNYSMVNTEVLRQISDIETSILSCLDSIRAVSDVIKKEKDII